MKALILAPFSATALERLGHHIDVAYESWMDSRRVLPAEELIGRIQAEDIGILVIEADFVMREVFEKADRLRLVGACRGTVTHVDIEAAKERGVLVLNTPGRNAIAVAELTLGLMLSLARRIPAASRMVSSGEWVDPVMPYISFRGTELTGKTVGVVGFGAIGREVVKRLLALGTSVVVHDPFVAASEIEGVGAGPLGLDELVAQSDFITLHCPASPQTVGLLDGARIASMKPTAYLVNATSAAVVDKDAIVQALREGRIAGAAFDDFETLTVPPDDPLLPLENVILTPHIGGATYETIERHSLMMADDIERFLRGERPRNLLNPDAWGKVV